MTDIEAHYRLREDINKAKAALGKPSMTNRDKIFALEVLNRVALAVQGMPIMEQRCRQADVKAARDCMKIERLKALIAHLVDKL